MSAPLKFRSAFNGFNREDVVHYLEYINSKHTAEVNQLTSEVEHLRTQLESAQPDPEKDQRIAALEQERSELLAQLEQLQAGSFEESVEEETAPMSVCGPAEELEAYRRAERTERMARERAELIYHQANNMLSEASLRINDAAAQITPAADQVLAQLEQLQAAIAAGKQSLQDAAVIIGALRPGN